MSRAFCVVCGLETDEELRHGVCAKCYLEKNALVSLRTTVDVDMCVHCHARKRGEIWLEGHGEIAPVVEDGLREAVQFDKVVTEPRVVVRAEAEDERNYTVHVIATGVAEGVPFERTLVARSRVKNATCLRCSRVQGGYYESIVQLRAYKRDVSDVELRGVRQLASRFIDRIVAEGDRNAFVLRDVAEHGGLDIYMGTTNSGRMLAKAICVEFGGKVAEHHKTVGQKDGLDIIRMTFAVRLPEYAVHDIVILRDEPFRISSIGAKTVQLTELKSGRLRHVERSEMDRAVVLKATDKREAVVVSETATEYQLLDPWTYNTVSVIRPAGVPDHRANVLVIRHEEEIIVIPS